MANPDGTHIWYELMTGDVDASQAFYEKVVGWTVKPSEMPGVDYRMFMAGDAGVGGMMHAPDPAMPKSWLGYVGVSDVDAVAGKAKELGATVYVPPTDIPGVGRFALLADPQGALFYIMHGSTGGESHAYDEKTPGHCSWNELSVDDQAAALDFYNALFGWRKSGAMAMGAMGDYTFISLGERAIGAIMTRPAKGAPAGWTYYFRVPSIAAAAEAAAANGAIIVHGPADVPGGDKVIVAIDPQGVQFALVGGG